MDRGYLRRTQELSVAAKKFLTVVILYDNMILPATREAAPKMNKAGVKFEEIHSRLMKDEEFKAEYDKLKPRYELIAQIIDVRNQLNITQEELAMRMGTQKSNISRFESGSYNPSLDFITKIARSLGKEIHISIE